MTEKDFALCKKFTTNGEDVWEMIWFCYFPTCGLKNLATGEIQDVTATTEQAKLFRPIKGE